MIEKTIAIYLKKEQISKIKEGKKVRKMKDGVMVIIAKSSFNAVERKIARLQDQIAKLKKTNKLEKVRQAQPKTALGMEIKQFRQRNNMTQAMLAKEVGVSDQCIAFWEAGTNEPSENNKIKLDKAMKK